MFIVVECASAASCTDFGSAPACTIQVAHDVRSERQFTLSPKRRSQGRLLEYALTLRPNYRGSLQCAFQRENHNTKRDISRSLDMWV